MAPELISQHRVEIGTSSDVYGFAMLCLEILTGLPPYHNVSDEQLISMVRIGIPPEKPEGDLATRWLSEDLWELLLSCWALEPASRPDMAAIVTTLRLIQRSRTDTTISLTR